ncbi:MAG: glycosyltransferase [Deferribacteraceae bacterium]|jgi:glycosyltransferase involved in cell wall biosynthesis|nr:glycosyltransferase [Deferribacteraceae bacterium]
MKILLYYYNLNSIGGAPRVYSRIASHWAEEKGYEVCILSHFGHPKSFYPISPKVRTRTAFPFYSINPGRIPRNLLSPFLFPKLLVVLLQFKPDIIIVNNAPYYGVIQAVIARLFRRKVPLVIWKHSGVFMKSSFLYKITKRLLFATADAVVALTDGDSPLTRNKNTYVIRNPIPTVYSAEKGEFERGKTALFVGRLVPQKNLNHLLKAWVMAKDSLNGWKLVIVGGGELESSIKGFARKLKLTESVVFAGETDSVAEYYKTASFFVMSSMHEGLPVVLIEALFYGLPAVSYDCPFGPREIIKHNVNGILVENGNIAALSEAIVKMVLDNEFREKLAAGTAESMDKFSMEGIAADWDKLFSDLLPHSRS